jgi:hypothetical protein
MEEDGEEGREWESGRLKDRVKVEEGDGGVAGLRYGEVGCLG